MSIAPIPAAGTTGVNMPSEAAKAGQNAGAAPTKAFDVGGPQTQQMEPNQVSGVGEVSKPPGVFQEREQILAETQSLVRDYQAGKLDQSTLMGRLMTLQIRAQDVAFRVELVSKVIEHGTSGAKTVLQTQA